MFGNLSAGPRFVPESPRWLISQNKHAEALKITEAIANENKRELSKKCKVKLLESFWMTCPVTFVLLESMENFILKVK